MKTIALIIIGFVTMLPLNISSVRKEYKATVLHKVKAELLYDKLQKITKKDNKVLLAYKGAITALIAKKQKGAKAKKEFFKRGVALLEFAVKSKPTNIEIRFIRLTVQQNAPKFLKYNTQIEKDKSFVFKQLKTLQSVVLKKYITDYIVQSVYFTEVEKRRLKSI